MHSTVAPATIATTQSNCDRPIVKTPQRKANYNEKDRPRRKDLKAEAFRKYGCSCTPQIKKYLKVVGIKLDLRLTAAWKAIVRELENEIVAAKAIVDALEPPQTTIKVGSKVEWTGYTPRQSYIAQWFPLQVVAIAQNMVQLELLSFPVPVSELVLV